MKRLIISDRARQDLDDIWKYIAKDKPRAADKQIERFQKRFSQLARQPLMGELRSDLRPNLRITSIGNYAVFYYATSTAVEIVGVLHGARDIEGLFRRGDR